MAMCMHHAGRRQGMHVGSDVALFQSSPLHIENKTSWSFFCHLRTCSRNTVESDSKRLALNLPGCETHAAVDSLPRARSCHLRTHRSLILLETGPCVLFHLDRYSGHQLQVRTPQASIRARGIAEGVSAICRQIC